MSRIPYEWRRSVCPQCGREVLSATRAPASGQRPTERVLLDATPRAMFVETSPDGWASLTDCYTPHLATCDYRGDR